MIGSKTAEADGSDGIRSCFELRLGDEVLHPLAGSVPIPVELLISSKIADGLRAKGFRVTEPIHGKPSGTEAFYVRFSEFDVIVVVFAEGVSEFHDYRVRTSCLRPFWRRVSPQSVSEGWIHACAAIERTLREDLKATSLLWLTDKEAREGWQSKNGGR